MNGTTTLDMAYDSNKGGITTKNDAGTLLYGTPGKPYAVSSINPSTGLTPGSSQTITCNSFGKISGISENNYSASFVYKSDDERAKMVITQSGNHVVTRYYPDDSFMKDSTSGVVKSYTYIGGDAYTAPVVAVKQGANKQYFYLLRDYLGNITHIIDSVSTVVAEYSFFAWGKGLTQPAFGAIAIYKSLKHVAFVSGYNPSIGCILLLGGNQPNVRLISVSRNTIGEFRHPSGYSPNFDFIASIYNYY